MSLVLMVFKMRYIMYVFILPVALVALLKAERQGINTVNQ